MATLNGSSVLVRSSPEAVSTRTPRPIKAKMPSSWVTRSRANRLASSTRTVRTPLLSIRSRRAANPGRASIGSAPDTAGSYKAIFGELIADVREVAFYHLTNEGAHRGEILYGASVVELFQNDPAEIFAGHDPALLFLIPPLQVILPGATHEILSLRLGP